MGKFKIYIVDDEMIIRKSLVDEFRDLGNEVYEFASPLPALATLREDPPDLVITDLKMPEMNGINFLKKLRQFDEGISVVMITAYSEVSTAVEAMKIGAYEYLSKPFEMEEMIMIVERVKELKKLRRQNQFLTNQIKTKFTFSSFVGDSPEIKQLFALIKMVLHSNTSVLINGETGTGKELLANIIHYNSDRQSGPFVKVSCAVLSRELFESEIFGHEKGAFTGADYQKIGRFEQADGGSIYLDEIDDIPLDLQVKLLRAIEEREIERVGGKETIKIDIRVIASTKKDLKQLVSEGKFREDLYYRLSVFPLTIPPLRDRKQDVLLLFKSFLSRFSNNTEYFITEKAYEIILNYDFPGNARELRNLSERLVLMTPESTIDVENLPIEIKYPDRNILCANFENRSLNEIVEEIEKSAILQAMEKSGGNKAKAAVRLGIPASTLKSKIYKYGLG